MQLAPVAELQKAGAGHVVLSRHGWRIRFTPWMAWRIDEHVIRGKIDNRTRGRVIGEIWLVGRDEPVVLDLKGDAWRDLAGRSLEFVNPEPKAGLEDDFATLQEGRVGDITASRKVRVPEIPLDQIGDYYAAKKPFPWHWGNALYFEWFGNVNGRVVIESVSYQLTVSPDSTWDMTAAEEEAQRIQNAMGMDDFLEDLSGVEMPPVDGDADLADTHDAEGRDSGDYWCLMFRVLERLRKEGGKADKKQIVYEEVNRLRRERDEPEFTPNQEEEQDAWLRSLNAEHRELLKPAEKDEIGEPVSDDFKIEKHPLALRSGKLAIRVMCDVDEHGWIPEGAGLEHPVKVLIADLVKAAVKIEGAVAEASQTIIPIDRDMRVQYLKNAIECLDDARLAVESCEESNLVDAEWLDDIVFEIDAVAVDTQEEIKRAGED